MTRIGKEDQQIAAQVRSAKLAVNAARMHTVALEARVRGEQRTISARAAPGPRRARCPCRRARLAGGDAATEARGALEADRERAGRGLRDRRAPGGEQPDRRPDPRRSGGRCGTRSAAASAATPADGQSTAPPPPPASSSGLIWPVNGPVTSPYGWRWGRMHQGIDIGVADRNADPRRRRGNGHLLRLGGGLRQPRRASTTAATSRPPTATSRRSPSRAAST